MQIKVKSLPYILVVRKEPVSLKCQKEINQLKIKEYESNYRINKKNRSRGCNNQK